MTFFFLRVGLEFAATIDEVPVLVLDYITVIHRDSTVYSQLLRRL